NVETLASVALILQHTPQWFAEYGTSQSKGTKTFALVGKVKNTGLIEVPLGITLREIIYDIGGGLLDGRAFKAVQTGGPSGGCIPAAMLDLTVDYDSLTSAGSIMGSGGMVVMDDSTCMVDFARFFLEFAQRESCGKCVPCRLGTTQMLQILDDITKGKGKLEDIDLLINLGEAIKKSALCGLGQTAPNPVLTTIKYFRDEYEAHIIQKKCPAAVCKEIISSPCQHTCPIGTEAPVYIAYLAQGKFKEAFQSILKDNPLPSVCARVCHHPCELKCQAGRWDKPIAIRALKRFAAGWALSSGAYPPKKIAGAQSGPKVAIVGSGPAGLTAGYSLANKGYCVTIFEALDVIGGALNVCIPEYRLPKDMLSLDLDNIRSSGVTFRANTRIGKDISLSALKEEYQAVLIATGAHKSRKLKIPNEDAEGVLSSMEFLKRINLGKNVTVGEKVGVIGGGNSAVDAARCAARIKGCDRVVLIYRRTRNEMPAFKEEVDALIEEGIETRFLAAPKRIIAGNSKMQALECVGMKLGEPDESGRRRPYPVEGSECIIELDTLIVAIGESPDVGFINKDADIKVSKQGAIEVDRETLTTGIKGVFAAGDCAGGPNTVIDAMSQGKIVSSMIDRYLRGEPLRRDYKCTRPSVYVPAVELTDEEIENAQRPAIPQLNLCIRKDNFKEVDLNLEEEQATREARRCLRCDLETQDAKALLGQ
ncbi:FAD-dependent oxidoreductase, partial [Candidatus Omnitrophota bacterium]